VLLLWLLQLPSPAPAIPATAIHPGPLHRIHYGQCPDDSPLYTWVASQSAVGSAPTVSISPGRNPSSHVRPAPSNATGLGDAPCHPARKGRVPKVKYQGRVQVATSPGAHFPMLRILLLLLTCPPPPQTRPRSPDIGLPTTLPRGPSTPSPTVAGTRPQRDLVSARLTSPLHAHAYCHSHQLQPRLTESSIRILFYTAIFSAKKSASHTIYIHGNPSVLHAPHTVSHPVSVSMCR